MASQNIDEKEQFSIEHVEHVNDEKGEHVNHDDRVDIPKHEDKFHAMRIDGDEEDHMHEPPASGLNSNKWCKLMNIDDILESDELDCNGLYMGRLTNPSLPVW
jgi:hypothetical protein